jgi:putative protease
VPELVAAGVDAVTIDARGKTADYAREMVRVYREAIASAAQKPGTATRDTASLRERVKAIALGGITTGHYPRGLKEG